MTQIKGTRKAESGRHKAHKSALSA